MNPYLARRAFGGRRVLVGVCGGVAAYKVVDIVSELVQAGAEVRVLMTPEASRFVTPLTFEAVSGGPVGSDLFGTQATVGRGGGEAHVSLSDWPEVILLAPATANVMAKLSVGLADEMVTTTVLASRAPLVLAPAMHNRMWENEATRTNLRVLRDRGVVFAGPIEGRLASGEIGMGRLADTDEVLRTVAQALGSPGDRDFSGVRVLVTAGATRENLDPVRFIGNRSSGLMGHAIAAAAEARGADVVLVTSSDLPVPTGVELVHVESAAEMAEAVRAQASRAALLVMAAAVADFRPRHASPTKMRKADVPTALELVETEDVLGSLATAAGAGSDADSALMVRVGFAAETGDVVGRARQKLVAKDLDVIVANDVSDPTIGMGAPDNRVTILDRDGGQADFGPAPKVEIADRVLDAALAVIRSRNAGVLVS